MSEDSITYLCNVSNTSETANQPSTDAVTWTSTGDDLAIIYVTYVKQLTDVDKFTPLFKNVVAMQLASMIVTALHNDPKGTMV